MGKLAWLGGVGIACVVAGGLPAPSARAQSSPSNTGQSGYISMPDARVASEAGWRTGLSFMRPYQALWTSVAVFPWAEASFRFTRTYGVPGFSQAGTDYGDYKDKSFDVKTILLPERHGWPSIAVGAQDMAGGTGLYRAYYAVASKRIGELDLSLGYGARRIDGLFGGVRWTPGAAPNWSLVAEYDAFDYKRDFGSALSGSDQYKKEPAVGVEYRYGWIGAKAFAAHGNLGFNAYVSIPLDRKEFIPKIEEPAPYTRVHPRPTEEQWRADRAHGRNLVRALRGQDYREIRLHYANGVLDLALTNTRISSMPRAIGRAARTALAFAPLEVREIHITYLQGTLPVATYEFINVPLLARYFNGMANREQLAQYVAVRYARPDEQGDIDRERREALSAFDEPLGTGLMIGRDGPDAITLRGENVLGGQLRVRPAISTYLNDPSGAFKFDLSAIASFNRPLGEQAFLQAELKATVYENVSDVTQPSNSLLPKVRSDVAEYKKASRIKILRLLGNRYYHPAERVYVRASAGIYEEMFSGAGGQVLYMPPDGSWAVDLSADWLKQREFRGWFGHQGYSVLTAIASLNYRLAQGVTATARAGRFLAGDEGVRLEGRRRFGSGFEVGIWYTWTNGRDITSPGSPSAPYRDKGLFMVMPLDTLLTTDTQATAGFALSPWTRDVGQMVGSPGDLYRMLERPVRQMHALDGLSRLGDRDDDYDLPRLGADRQWPDFLLQDAAAFGRSSAKVQWMNGLVLGGAALAGSVLLDNRAHRFASDHRNASWMRNGVKVGDALPIAAMGASAVFAFDESRPRLADAGLAAVQAGALAFGATEGVKRLVGRARPAAGAGRAEFEPGSSKDLQHSFPSRHTAVMWAAVTPYAEEFGMRWLYGVAALTNAARVGSREHWFSDTVGGAMLGYALGQFALDVRRDARQGKRGPSLVLGANTLALSWELD